MEQSIGIAKREMRLGGIMLLALAVIVFEYIVSSSIASVAFSAFIVACGLIIVQITSLKSQEKSALVYVFFAAFSIVTIATVIRWLGNEASGSLFFNDANDQYKFWIASQEGSRYHSVKEIYKSCLTDNLYLRNGGYYFYIQTLCFIAEKYFDGNHLLLQQLGTSFSAVLSSVFIFLILRKYSSPAKTVKYSLIYLAFTPIIIDSIGLHRDSIISLLYLVIIYIWLCKKLNLVSFAIQVLVCLILTSFRFQHGLFAIIFIILSIVNNTGKRIWLYLIAISLVLFFYGYSYFDVLVGSLSDTFDYYGEVTDYTLRAINSGLGRYVYILPHPIKEIIQVIWLELQFPPWYDMISANNGYLFILGALSLVIYVFWFYIFSLSCVSVLLRKKSKVPEELKIGLIVFFVFILLNSSNLDLRRVICVYPLLFVLYVYSRDTLLEMSFIRKYNHYYLVGYVLLSFAYLVIGSAIG